MLERVNSYIPDDLKDKKEEIKGLINKLPEKEEPHDELDET